MVVGGIEIECPDMGAYSCSPTTTSENVQYMKVPRAGESE